MFKEGIEYLIGTVGLDPTSRIGESLVFFVYDSIKIILLIFVMIFIVGFFRTYLSASKVKEWLTKKRYGSANFFAALFGSLTPFCSCSSIPIFLGFLEAGVPLGVTFSFLITSPLINEYLVILMFGFFGLKITAIYIISGLLIGIISGLILGQMGLEKHITKDFQRVNSKSDKEYTKMSERLVFGLNEAKKIVRKLWIWILVGVAVGAVIHN